MSTAIAPYQDVDFDELWPDVAPRSKATPHARHIAKEKAWDTSTPSIRPPAPLSPQAKKTPPQPTEELPGLPAKRPTGVPLGRDLNHGPLSSGGKYESLWRMRNLAADWLPHESANFCCHHVKARLKESGKGVTAGWNPGVDAGLADAATCNDVWLCVICGKRIGEKRREELDGATKRWQKKKGGLLLISYTPGSHHKYQSLADVNGVYKKARKYLAADRRYKKLRAWLEVEHGIKAREQTVGEANGWHPNGHDLLFTSPEGRVFSCPTLEKDALQKLIHDELSPIWLDCLVKAGLPRPAGKALEHFDTYAVDVKIGYDGVAEYIAKWGKEPEKQWSLASEMARAASKTARGEHYTPFGLLRDAVQCVRTIRTMERDAERLGVPVDTAAVDVLLDQVERNRRWFTEYAAVFKGTRQLIYSDGAKAALGIGQEEETAEGEEQVPKEPYYKETLQTYDAEWHALRERRMIGRALDAAVKDGKAGILAVIAEAIAELPAAELQYIEPLLGDRWRFVPGCPFAPGWTARATGPPVYEEGF